MKNIEDMSVAELTAEVEQLDGVRKAAQVRQRQCQEEIWRRAEEEELSKKHGRKAKLVFED